MLRVLLEMSALIGFGTLWQTISPARLDAQRLRHWLTQSVFYVFLPALVLKVLWQAPLNADSLRISATAISAVFFALFVTRIIYRYISIDRAALGAVLLAAIFPNVTYMGLPVLNAIYGDWAQAVAIQYDLFGTLPIMTALIWLSIPVVPFILFAIGLNLNWHYFKRERLLLLWPVIVVQFMVAPVYAWLFASGIGLEGDWLDAVVLEAAMPCMVLGIVLCDRYGLDSRLFATAVTLTTVASIAIIPLWFSILQI